MEMDTKNESTRVGIYTQKSVGAATTGDGFAPQGEKSPVAELKTQQDFPYATVELKTNKNINQSQNTDIKRSNKRSIKRSQQDWRVRKFIDERFSNMRKQLKKLKVSRGELCAMETSLEAEYKKSYNYQEIFNFVYRDGYEPPPELHAEVLSNRRRRSLSFKSEERSRSRFDYRNRDRNRDRSRSPSAIWRQSTTSRKKREPENVHNSSNRNWSSFAGYEKQPIRDRSREHLNLNWDNRSPDQQYSPFGSERDRPRSPFSVTRRDDEFEEFRRKMGLPGNDDYDDNFLYSDPDNLQPSLPMHKSSYETEKKICKLEVQILNRADPFGKIPEEIQSLMLETLQKTLEIESANAPRRIIYDDIYYKNSTLYVQCGTQKTVSFLEKKVPLLNQFIPNVDLYALKKKYRIVQVSVNNFDLTSEEFFKIIKKQNDYPTELWREYQRQGDTENMILLLGIDSDSYERLKTDKGSAYYFLKRIKFQLVDK